MKALSIRQPWAWAIVHAGKDIENRSRRTTYRGPVLIHASQGMTRAEYTEFRDFNETLERYSKGYPVRLTPPSGRFLRGGIIGKAEIIDCVSEHSSPWFTGPFGFVLANAEPLPFYACKGRLGFFDVEMPACS